MYVIRMILAFSCVMYEEVYWNQVSIFEVSGGGAFPPSA